MVLRLIINAMHTCNWSIKTFTPSRKFYFHVHYWRLTLKRDHHLYPSKDLTILPFAQMYRSGGIPTSGLWSRTHAYTHGHPKNKMPSHRSDGGGVVQTSFPLLFDWLCVFHQTAARYEILYHTSFYLFPCLYWGCKFPINPSPSRQCHGHKAAA